MLQAVDSSHHQACLFNGHLRSALNVYVSNRITNKGRSRAWTCTREPCPWRGAQLRLGCQTCACEGRLHARPRFHTSNKATGWGVNGVKEASLLPHAELSSQKVLPETSAFRHVPESRVPWGEHFEEHRRISSTRFSRWCTMENREQSNHLGHKSQLWLRVNKNVTSALPSPAALDYWFPFCVQAVLLKYRYFTG